MNRGAAQARPGFLLFIFERVSGAFMGTESGL